MNSFTVRVFDENSPRKSHKNKIDHFVLFTPRYFYFSWLYFHRPILCLKKTRNRTEISTLRVAGLNSL